MVRLPRVTLNQLGRILVGGHFGLPVYGDVPFPAPPPAAYRGNELLVYRVAYQVYLFSLTFLTPTLASCDSILRTASIFFFKLLCSDTNSVLPTESPVSQFNLPIPYY